MARGNARTPVSLGNTAARSLPAQQTREASHQQVTHTKDKRTSGEVDRLADWVFGAGDEREAAVRDGGEDGAFHGPGLDVHVATRLHDREHLLVVEELLLVRADDHIRGVVARQAADAVSVERVHRVTVEVASVVERCAGHRRHGLLEDERERELEVLVEAARLDRCRKLLRVRANGRHVLRAHELGPDLGEGDTVQLRRQVAHTGNIALEALDEAPQVQRNVSGRVLDALAVIFGQLAQEKTVWPGRVLGLRDACGSPR